jgi:hypothetical protein
MISNKLFVDSRPWLRRAHKLPGCSPTHCAQGEEMGTSAIACKLATRLWFAHTSLALKLRKQRVRLMPSKNRVLDEQHSCQPAGLLPGCIEFRYDGCFGIPPKAKVYLQPKITECSNSAVQPAARVMFVGLWLPKCARAHPVVGLELNENHQHKLSLLTYNDELCSHSGCVVLWHVH